MVSNRFPFTGSGRQKEGGELATRKQDFNAHYQGNGFRHTAPNIDMSPVIPSLGGATVQETLEQITTLISSNGTGFISIGNADGYAIGTYNMNTVATPTLANAFNAAFADDRLQNGGIILVLAGTYVLTTSVTVPPGITIIGEVGGTLIIGEMTEQSMFIISSTAKDVRIGGNSGSGTIPLSVGSNVEKVKFFNLMLSDNLNGTVATGGTSMATVPMIALNNAANLELERVSFIGRINDGAIANRPKTSSAVSSTSGGSTGTTLTVKDCFFDGLRNAIQFIPQLGDKDYLTVTGCKARTFGTEGFAVIAFNSFIFASLCNMNITNNHHVGAGTITNTFLGVTITGGTTNVNVIVSGNTGSASTASLANLVSNVSGVTFNSVITGNSWGNQLNNPWYVVVGGADGDSPLGDIYGPDAINTIFSFAVNSGLDGTVVINPGTYTVTAGASGTTNFLNLKFIGNKKGKAYPVFNLNITDATTDSLGNKFLTFGNHLESIQFNSITSTQSVRPGFSPTSRTAQSAAHTLTVKDCIFTNTSLNIMDTGVGPFSDVLGNTAKLGINVENCYFRQTGAFSDNVSLVAPRVNYFCLRDSHFTGFGYAANIGTATYTPASITDAEYFLENVTMDLTSFTIDDVAPGAATIDTYLVIDDPTNFTAKVYMNNCQVLASSSFSSVTPINASLDTTFTKFIYIRADEVIIDNSNFCGPNQTFDVAAVDYVLPCLYIEPLTTVKVTNSRILSGGLPLQIGGTSAFSSAVGTLRDALIVDNCEIMGVSTSITQTVFDIDVDVTSSFFFSGMHLTNNTFISKNSSNPIQVLHTAVTGATYDAQGLVQIYCRAMNVYVAGNQIHGQLRLPTTNPYTHFGGLVINTFNSDQGSSTTVSVATVSDNRIQIHANNINTVTAANSSQCLWIRGNVAAVHDNFLNLQNSGAASSSFSGCLNMDMRLIGATGDGVVSGNIFSRTGSTGTDTSLARGYIQIASTNTVRGMIVDNSFNSTTYNGSSIDLLEDNSSDANKWVFERNKNQTVEHFIRACSGVFTNGDNSATFDNQLFVPWLGTDVQVFVNSDALGVSGDTLQVTSLGTSYNINMRWRVNLYEVLPANVHIVSVQQDCHHSVDLPAAGTDQFTLRLISGTVTVGTDTHDMHSGAGIVDTMGPISPAQGVNSRMDSVRNFSVETTIFFNSGTATVAELRAFKVTYKW